MSNLRMLRGLPAALLLGAALLGCNADDATASCDASPAGTLLYAPLWDEGVVQVIDPRVGREVKRYALNHPKPFSSYLSPDKRKLYVLHFEAFLSVVDLATGQLGEVQVGGLVDSAAFSPDGSALYVAITNDPHGIRVVDTATLSVRSSFPIANVLCNELSSDGQRMYVGTLDGQLLTIDPNSGAELGPAIAGNGVAAWLSVNRAGTIAYTADLIANVVHVVDLRAQSIIKSIPVGKLPLYTALSPDESQLWVTCEGTGISVIDTSANEVVRSLAYPTAVANSAFSPDGKTVYVPESLCPQPTTPLELLSLHCAKSGQLHVIDASTFEESCATIETGQGAAYVNVAGSAPDA